MESFKMPQIGNERKKNQKKKNTSRLTSIPVQWQRIRNKNNNN